MIREGAKDETQIAVQRVRGNMKTDMKEYDIILQNGHILVAEAGGKLLIDTGSPMSFHSTGRLTLCGQTFSVPTTLMNVDADYVSDKVGTRVEGFVGMDIIARLGMSVDLPAGKLTFGADTQGWHRIPSSIFGVVKMDVTVGGKPACVALDTGAPISYISPAFTEGYACVATETDFSPFSGTDTFEVPIYEVPVSLDGGEGVTMRLGTLPPDVGGMLSLFRLDGAIGLELLSGTAVLIADGSVWLRS